MTFEIYFLISLITKKNDDSSWGKMSFVEFHFINAKGNWAHV